MLHVLLKVGKTTRYLAKKMALCVTHNLPLRCDKAVLLAIQWSDYSEISFHCHLVCLGRHDCHRGQLLSPLQSQTATTIIFLWLAHGKLQIALLNLGLL